MNQSLFIKYEIPTIKQINTQSGRMYSTPSGKKYPSVTTVIGIESSVYIKEWRDRIGHAEADKISRAAAARGTKIHEACENHLNGKENVWGMFDAENKEMFSVLSPVLSSIQEIHAMETRLYSDALETAGTVDLICKIDNKMTVLDWKTSSRYKSRDDIFGYFKQCAFYAQSFYERTGIIVPNITIAMTVKDYGLVLFQEKVRDWVPEFIETRKNFRELKGY